MATLLPSPEIQFIDANGNPIAGGTVETYVPNTLTPKTTWQDSAQSISNTNPVVLDAAGRAIIYGSGTYRFIVRDASGNLVFDQLTADTAVGGIANGGVSTGSANAQVVAASSFSSQDGQALEFIAGFSNTGPLTVTPSGGSAIPVLYDAATGPQPLVGGEVITDNAILLLYEAARGAFHIVNPASGTITGGTINGATFINGTINTTTLVLKQSSDPTPTAEGDMQWSTLFNHLKIGDGSGTQRFVPGAAPGAIVGCTIANNSTDPTNDIDFASGAVTDSTYQFYMATAALTKRLDATWAAGTNQGGLFSGAIANDTYHCFIIMRPDTGVVDAGFDTSPIAANRPGAYTYFRRVGSIVRAAAAIKAFTQTGDFFFWNAAVSDYSAVPSTAGANVTLTVPTDIVVVAQLSAAIALTGGNVNFQYYRISPLTETNAAASISNFTLAVSKDDSTENATASWVSVPTNTSAQVRHRGTLAAGTLAILTNGWIDDRGRTS